MREEMIKRERNLGCLRRRMGVPWWRRWLVPSRCEWEATGWNAWGVEVESRCSRCGNFRHHRFSDRKGEMIAWRAGRHPKAEEAAGPPHKRITDIIKERGWKPLPVHLREERIPTVSSENTQDQQPGGAAAENQTCEPNDSERLYWLQRNLRGSELRRLGLNMIWTGDRQEFRERLDAQIGRNGGKS